MFEPDNVCNVVNKKGDITERKLVQMRLNTKLLIVLLDS